MARQFKLNKVSLDLEHYYHYIRGVEKSGKTTLFRDLILDLYGDATKGLLLGIGKEVGYKALDNIQPEQISTWGEFVELIDDLEEDARNHECDIKMIAIDTIDELVDLAIKEVLRLHKKAKGEKCDSINSAFGGYGRGKDMVTDMVDTQLFRIKQMMGLVVIGHTKLKTIKEKGTGDEYQQLTSNLTSDYDGIVSHKADIIATISIENNIKDGKLVGTTRFINFRSNGVISCGARFEKIADRVELSSGNYIKAIQDAIRNSSNIKDDKEFETKLAEQKIEQQKKVEEYVNYGSTEDKDKLIETFKVKLKESSQEKQLVALSKLKELNITSLESLDNLDNKKIIELIGLLD